MHCVKNVQKRVFSGPYFPVFSPNTRKNEPKKTLHLDTFHARSDALDDIGNILYFTK